MKRAIAEHTFDCVDRRGKRFKVLVRVGEPLASPRQRKGPAKASCKVSMEPLMPERTVRGIGSFQTLCLTVDLVRRVLKSFVADGGRVYYRESNAPVKLHDPVFYPWPALDALRQDTSRKASGRSTRGP